MSERDQQPTAVSSTLLNMLEAAGRDERLATGQLYLDAKARIEELEKRLDPVRQALAELVRLKDIKEAWARVPQLQGIDDPRMEQWVAAERAYFDDYKVNVGKAWLAARNALRPPTTSKGEVIRKAYSNPKGGPEYDAP